MVAYQGGEAAAFARVYEALAPALRRYLTSLARDPVRGEDLVQETFLQIHRARRTYQPGRPVRPWVYAIARNVFLMGERARRRRDRREVIADQELPEIPVAAAGDEVLARRELARAVERLGRPRCEELLLHHVAGLSFREIGAVLGVSEGAAKVRAHRALKELRTMMGVHGDGDRT
jgi:RNA polymerase sigma-70 factor, ECF subfamily